MRSPRFSALVLAAVLTATSASAVAPRSRDMDRGDRTPAIVERITRKLPPVIKKLFGITTTEDPTVPKP